MRKIFIVLLVMVFLSGCTLYEKTDYKPIPAPGNDNEIQVSPFDTIPQLPHEIGH